MIESCGLCCVSNFTVVVVRSIAARVVISLSSST